MRKKRAKKRILLPDPRFGSVTVTRFVNNLMLDGKKNTAFKVFYTALDSIAAKIEEEEEFAICVDCGNSIEKCVCVCPYCGERDKCECALFDAATGG